MQRSSSKLGQLYHSVSSLGSLQRRTVASQSSNSFCAHGAVLSRKDKLMEPIRGFLEETAQARVKDERTVVRRGGTGVLDRAANWVHATPMRKRRIPPQGIPQQSVEKILSVPSDVFDDDAFNTELGDQMLPKGSFLEVRRNNAVIHAVAMGPYYSGRGRQIHTLTTTGEAIPFNDADVMLCVPGFVEERLMDACGTTKLHTTNAELAARTRVLAELRAIEKEIERAVRYVDNRASKFYDYLKSDNPYEWKKVDVQTAARFYKRPDNLYPSLAINIAVHKHLMDHPRKFVAHPTAYRETQTFLVRPPVQAQNIADITNWMRIEGGRILNEFCDKVKVIMEQGKALRQRSTSTMPHEIPTNYNYTLTDTDREILRFLLDAFHAQRLTQSNPHSLPANYILKRLGMLDDMEWPVNQLGALQQVLTDLGVFSPWTDSASFASRIESLAQQPVIKPLRAPAYPPKPLGPEDLYASDPLEALRHDFGNMPVYVIDDASASELDDGVSIETIPSEPDNYWVHVHVADPTTLLPPTHTLAYRAREMSESSYLVYGTRYMLPPSTFERFSLGYTAATKEPQQVMTFSFKVDAAGDIIDYKVRAAIVKNVHIMTYDAVDATLGLPSFALISPFELPSPSPPSHSPIEPTHVERLKLLYKVSSRLTTNRALRPTFSFVIPSSDVRLAHPILPHLPSPSTETDVSTMRQFKLYGGFPEMSYSVMPPEASMRGARVMISEFMKGACRVASRFGVETGTPLVRRHGSGPLGPDPDAIERLIASRDEFGMVDQYEAAKASVVLPRTVNTLTPKRHWSLGIPDGEGYVRVTSPLRRYVDLIAHWQIKHTLLANSDPARYTKGKRVVFGEDWLLQYAREATFRDRERKRTTVMRGGYWSGMFLKRWLDGEIKSEALDSRTAVFEARPGVVVKDMYTGKYRMRSMVSQLGVWGDIKLDNPLEIGSRVNVRIAGVTMGPGPKVNLEPV
ncbi:RNB-domain-containing protein [Thelephora ganbajun]|uniref:RNB-domain-containing protein n=1 Tax=Thelephora ganbajun TaxID=370292 RepID=A0ACB6ZFD9_THEGA|nr:RNB-domain-containing protein [Thelephora ganbajun]